MCGMQQGAGCSGAEVQGCSGGGGGVAWVQGCGGVKLRGCVGAGCRRCWGCSWFRGIEVRGMGENAEECVNL